MEFNKSKYTNHDGTLIEINKSFQELHRLFIQLGTEYVNKISGTLDNELFYMFRESVLRRFGASLFHYDLLTNINVSGKPIKYDPRGSPPDGFYVTLYTSYLFDSIVFHVVSGFDYYAGLVKFISYGNLKKWKVTWTEMANKSKHIPTLSSSQLGSEINSLESGLVKDLTAYRSGLIHNKGEYPSFTQSSKLFQSESMVTIFPPKTFLKRFSNQLSDQKDYTLDEVTLWVLDNAITGIINLINATSIYFEVNRRISPEDELIRFTSKNKK